MIRAGWCKALADYCRNAVPVLRVGSRPARSGIDASHHEQRLDDLGERLELAMRNGFQLRRQQTEGFAARLRSPRQLLTDSTERLRRESAALQHVSAQLIRTARERYHSVGIRLSSVPVVRQIRRGADDLGELDRRLRGAVAQGHKDSESAWQRLGDLLESYSFERVLERGYSVVFDSAGDPITASKGLAPQDSVELRFSDGTANAVITSGKPVRKKRPKRESVGSASGEPALRLFF